MQKALSLSRGSVGAKKTIFRYWNQNSLLSRQKVVHLDSEQVVIFTQLTGVNCVCEETKV